MGVLGFVQRVIAGHPVDGMLRRGGGGGVTTKNLLNPTIGRLRKHPCTLSIVIGVKLGEGEPITGIQALCCNTESRQNQC